MTDKKTDKKISPAWMPIAKSIAIWTGITLGVLILLAGLLAGSAYGYTRIYSGKIYPGIKVAGVRLDGLTKEEANLQLDKAVDQALEKGLMFSLDGDQAIIQVASHSDVPDLIRYDINRAVEQAYQVGRVNQIPKIIIELLSARIRSKNVPVEIVIDNARLEESLKLQYASKLPEPVNATFAIQTASGQEPTVKVVPEQPGRVLDLEGVFEKIRQQAEALAFQNINLRVKIVEADKLAKDLQPLIDQVQEILNRPALSFTYDDQTYKIPTSTLAEWLVSDAAGDSVTIDHVQFASSVRALAGEVEVESKNGVLEVKDGEIVSFTASTVGRKINTEKTLEDVLNHWPASSTFPLVVEESRGAITGDDLEQFGIKEIIGVGKSNFAGSPTNRVLNIKKATYERVNGTLVAPGEEFSMLKNLGPIDGKNGWLPELVIKGNKTTPEYGGGLCQIGTTMFRGAVDSGLQVTERRNHSYRVSYYEPAGTDATIYEPSPDFKFKNDTDKHILINAYIQGTEVVFEMWGTKDGRKVTQTKPRIYNIVAAPPTKLIETEDLAPGKKKCTESAHAGADAEFSTTIEYADGRTREETFTSHYRPWGAVCLIGVEKLSESTDESTDTAGE